MEDRLNKIKESLVVIDDREKKLECKIMKLKSLFYVLYEVYILVLCCVFVCLVVFVGLLLYLLLYCRKGGKLKFSLYYY